MLTQGATQSNHARQTAACAAKMRIDCHILLEDRTGKTDHDYTESGNVLLDYLHGASIERCAANPDMNGELANSGQAEERRTQALSHTGRRIKRHRRSRLCQRGHRTHRPSQ